MIEDKRFEEKKGRLLELLEKGAAQVQLDARRPGVLVPEKYKNDMRLVLNLSYRYEPQDLTVNIWGVRETLSFAGSLFTVALPWSAIFAIGSVVTTEFFMYPDEMPPEIAVGTVDRRAGSAARRAEKSELSEVPPLENPLSAKVARSALRAVAGLTDEDSAEAAVEKSAETVEKSETGEPPKAEPTVNRSHLRVVK